MRILLQVIELILEKDEINYKYCLQ